MEEMKHIKVILVSYKGIMEYVLGKSINSRDTTVPHKIYKSRINFIETYIPT